MKWLTLDEQKKFLADFAEIEKDIQKYIAVYLSALAVIVGWIIGPRSQQLSDMVLGNGGLNVIACLVVVGVNALFSCFLTYKSLMVHELMQYVVYMSPPECGIANWEEWRRSKQSATRPVRTLYFAIISLVLLAVSSLVLYGIFIAVYSVPDPVISRGIAGSHTSSAVTSLFLDNPTVFRFAHWMLVGILALHVLPLVFVAVNVRPTNRRWDTIIGFRTRKGAFDELVSDPTSSVEIIDLEVSIKPTVADLALRGVAGRTVTRDQAKNSIQ